MAIDLGVDLYKYKIHLESIIIPFIECILEIVI